MAVMKSIPILNPQAAQRRPLAEPDLHPLIRRNPNRIPHAILFMRKDARHRPAAAGNHEPFAVLNLANQA